MADLSFYEVEVAYHDPFNIWERLEYCMKSILPLPVNVRKINLSRWNKNIQLPDGLHSEFSEGGSFCCTYVKADGNNKLNTHDPIVGALERPYLHLYVLPPMDYAFFKRHVMAPLKSFLSAHKSKGIVVIFGICDKENTEQQKSNCKTIDKVRRMFTSMSLSQSRLCLVPMLGLYLLNDSLPLSGDGDGDKNHDTLSFKNLESLALAMGDSISEVVSTRLADIAAVIHKAKWIPTNKLTLLYESIVRMYVKCGLKLDAINGYITLIKRIEPEVKGALVAEDFEHAPFIFYTEAVYPRKNDDSAFQIYQYLCSVSMQLLGGMNSVSNLCRFCHIILDYCFLCLSHISRNLSIKSILWSLALLAKAVSYLQEKIGALAESTQPLEPVVMSYDRAQIKKNRQSIISKLRATLKGKKNAAAIIQKTENSDDWVVHPFTTPPKVSDNKELSTDLVQLGTRFGCLHHNNGYKSIRRTIGMLHNFTYKILKNAEKLLPCDTFSPAAEEHSEDIFYNNYRQLEFNIWQDMMSRESRLCMQSDAIHSSALNFSHGDMPRFASVMESLNNGDDALSYMKKDSSVMGWCLKLFIDDNRQVFAWVGPHEPNKLLQDPLDRVKSVLRTNLQCLYNYPDTCLSPCHIEDEAINDYLRMLAEAKIGIGSSRPDFKVCGQFVRCRSAKHEFTLNICSLNDLGNANVRIRLYDHQELVEEKCATRHYQYEEVALYDVNIGRGINVFKVEHLFRKLSNYTLDSFTIESKDSRIVQHAYEPIPLGILRDVICASNSLKMDSKTLLSALILPTTFLQRTVKDHINIKVSPCSDTESSSGAVLLAGVRNFVTFQLGGFKGGKICLLKSRIVYDSDTVVLLSNGNKTAFWSKEETPDGLVMVIPDGPSSNYMLCLSAYLAADFEEAQVVQDVEVSANGSHELRLTFVVLPPFCREVLTTDNAHLQVVLEPAAPFLTQIESVSVNERVVVTEPTLLERGYRFCLSIDDQAMARANTYKASSSQCDKEAADENICSTESSQMSNVAEIPSIGSDGTSTVNVPEGPAKSSAADLSEDVIPSAPSTPENVVLVKYRALWRKCSHQHKGLDMGLEDISGALEYRFTVPHATTSDVVVEYKTPPFCVINKPFEATIVVRANTEVSFDYEIETNKNWFVEGPIRSKNHTLHQSDALTLQFKMVALSGDGGSVLQLPPVHFWCLKVPVVHKEILLLNTLDL